MPLQRLMHGRLLALSIVAALIVSSMPLLTENALGSASDPDAPSILFGLGPEASGVRNARLVQEAPVNMLSSWYHKPSNLSWMTDWSDDVVPEAYANGNALHLIVWTGDPEVNLSTPYGPACGRAYPLSSRFLDDMQQLAETFAGDGPLYVTMFTEFQTYPCNDNQWVGSENYYRALKDRYRETMDIFHRYAPNSRVSLGWGGWQASWDNQDLGQGRSLIPHFADVMNDSDFQSFQAMGSGTNVDDVRDMTRILSQYGTGQVMLAHYKPDSGSQEVFDQDTKTMLTDDFLADLAEDGLFAWSFMDNSNISASEDTYQRIEEAVTRYTAPWLVPDGDTADPPEPETPTATPTSTPEQSSCDVGSYLATYYNNRDLSGSPDLQRCESAIDYDWQTGAPADGVDSDRFSVRWSGKHDFAAGDYTFTVTADDGVHLLVDGEPVIDNGWRDQSATTYTATVTLTAGAHEITVEYYEHTGDAVARLSWTSASTPTETPTPTPEPTATPSPSDSSLVLYDNEFRNGFLDGSFFYRSRERCDQSYAVSTPCSYALTLDGWGGLNFMTSGSSFDVSPYTALEWYVHPHGLPISTFSALFTAADGNGVINQVTLSPANIEETLPNGFVLVSVPIADLNPDRRPISAIQLKNATADGIPEIHIDDVRLVAS